MTRIISIANHKGGVGKTTSTASIGAVLSSKGYRVLLVDLDAQGNLTTSLLGDEEPNESIYTALKGISSLPVVEVKENLYLTPSSLELAGMELELSDTKNRESLLKNLLKPVATEYDFILLDTPPSLGLIAVNAFVAANELIIPLTAETLPFKGLRMITEAVERVKKRLNPNLTLSGILITRWGGRKLNKIVEEALRDKFGEVVFTSKIRENIAIAEAPLYQQDITAYSSNSNGAKDYTDLTEELLNR